MKVLCFAVTGFGKLGRDSIRANQQDQQVIPTNFVRQSEHVAQPDFIDLPPGCLWGPLHVLAEATWI